VWSEICKTSHRIATKEPLHRIGENFSECSPCGHSTGYQPDPVKLQGYYSDITQLVLLNPKFA
jgi:hypothetical protein